MADYIPDPDFEGFDGVYLDPKMSNAPPNEYNLSALAKYLRETGKQFKELTKAEKKQFVLQ